MDEEGELARGLENAFTFLIDHDSFVLEENKTEFEDTDDVTETDADIKAESAALYGSLGFAFGGHNELLQDQFILHTKAQKKDQIILLQVSM